MPSVEAHGGILMNTDDIDWIFDSSREGQFPRGGIWRLAVKYWVLGLILAAFAAVAAAIALRMCPKDVPLQRWSMALLTPL